MRGFEKVHSKWLIKSSHCISFWDPSSQPIKRFKATWTTAATKIKTKNFCDPKFSFNFLPNFSLLFLPKLMSSFSEIHTWHRMEGQCPVSFRSYVPCAFTWLSFLWSCSHFYLFCFFLCLCDSVLMVFMLEKLCSPFPKLSLNVVPLLLVMTSFSYINHTTFHTNVIQDILYIPYKYCKFEFFHCFHSSLYIN